MRMLTAANLCTQAAEVLTTANLRTRAVEVIRASILGGGLAPGEISSAPGLAERLGVSTTPVREAMLDLATDGGRADLP